MIIIVQSKNSWFIILNKQWYLGSVIVKKARKSSWDIPFSSTSSGIFATYNHGCLNFLSAFCVSNAKTIKQPNIETNVKWSSAPWQPFCFSLSKSLILLFTIEGSQLIRKNMGLWTIFIAVATTVPTSQHKQTNKPTNVITTLLRSHLIRHPLHHAAVKATSNYRLCQNLCYVQIGSTLRSL